MYLKSSYIQQHLTHNNSDDCLITAAGNAFCECASLQNKLGSRHDAATAYVDAGNCYRYVNFINM